MNLFHRPYVLIPIALLWRIGTVSGQATVTDRSTAAERMLLSDPQELLELERRDHLRTSTTDLHSRDIREAPANIQVITAKQIEAAGARDLYEALQLVPGVAFAATANEAPGIAAHGIWAQESRFLFLLNGERMNENDLGAPALHIPIANIDRIEVILGPGPYMHESQSLLGSINVITRTADLGSGAQAVLRTGLAHGGTTMNYATVTGVHRINSDQEIGYLAGSARGTRSNSVDTSGANGAGVETSTFQFQYRWRTLKAFMMIMNDEQELMFADHDVQRRDLIVGLRQRIILQKGLEINWRLSHTDQLPGNAINTLDRSILVRNTTHERITGMAMLGYKPTAWSTLRIGLRAYQQRSEFLVEDSAAVLSINGDRQMVFTALSAFGELNVNGKFGSLTAGYKMEQHELLGSAMCPRLAYTKVLGRLHAKLLWSNAFGMPTLMMLNTFDPFSDPAPEYVTTYEGELGARFGKATLFTIHPFHTIISQPWEMMSIEGTDRYHRSGEIAREGADLRITAETGKITWSTGFGINRPAGETLPDPETIDLRSQATFFPEQRFTGVAAWQATRSFTLRTSGTWRSSIMNGTMEGSVPGISTSETILNAGLVIRPKASERLSIDLGCNNILDVERMLPSIAAPERAPFMLNGREFTFSFMYRFVE